MPLLFALGSLFSTAWACKDPGERDRLAAEIERHAQATRWDAVERAWEALEKTKCPPNAATAKRAALAARESGKTAEMAERLHAALALEEDAELAEELAALKRTYGRVNLVGHPNPRKRPPLVEEVPPFGLHEKNSIAWAKRVCAGTGSFEGMLPIGRYTFGSVGFEVVPGDDVRVVEAYPKK